MCEHVVSLGASTNGWRAGGGVQPFLGMWPSMCQSWVAIQMYSLESHGTENRGSFLQQYYPFLVDVGMAKHNTLLPLTGRRLALGRHQHHNDVLLLFFFFFCICTCSGDISTTMTMTWLLLSLLFFVFARDPTNDHHHVLRPRRIIIQSSWKKWCWSRKSGWRSAGLLSIYMKFVAFRESLGFLYVSLSKLVLLDSCTGRPYCSL